MDFIRRFLGLNKEEDELKDAQVFNSCVVDYANIYSLDLTDSFAKIRNLSNNYDLDFSIVVNIKRKDFFDRLDAISLVFKKFSSGVYFANGETDVEILRVLSRKIKHYGNAILFTGDYAIIEAAANSHTPRQVAFVCNESFVSENIESIRKRGYSLFVLNFITKKEGVLKRILKLRTNEIKNARGYHLSEDKEKYLLSLIPNDLSFIVKKAVEEERVFKDSLVLKYALINLCMRNKIDFYVNGNGEVKVRLKDPSLSLQCCETFGDVTSNELSGLPIRG